MYIGVWELGEFKNQSSLWDALAVQEAFPLVISMVGAGGKTSSMFRLAKELGDMGKRVIVTTSTRIMYPKDRQVEEISCCGDMEHVVWESNILVVGRAEMEGKLRGLPADQISGLSTYADVVLVEADGAKRLPVKVPGEHEPVIVPGSDMVIGCAGLDSIGKRLDEVCFRKDLASELLQVKESHRITAMDMAHILTHEQGTRKSVGNIPYRIILNKADDEKMVVLAEEVIREIGDICHERVMITSHVRNME